MQKYTHIQLLNYSHYYFKLIWYIIIESIYQQWYILDGLDWAWKHLKCARSQEFRRRDLTTSARILFDNSMHERSSYLASPNAGQITNYLCQKFWRSHIFVGIFLGVKTARVGMQSCRNCSHSRAQIGVSFDISMIWLSCKNVEFPIFWTLTSFDVMTSAKKASCISK